MSTFTRYAFPFLIGVYGIYEVTADHQLRGAIAIVVALFVFWIARRR